MPKGKCRKPTRTGVRTGSAPGWGGASSALLAPAPIFGGGLKTTRGDGGVGGVGGGVR